MKLEMLLAASLAIAAGSSAGQQSQSAPAKPASTPTSCPVLPSPVLSEADEALAHGKFEDAERLYSAMPVSNARTAGIVRAKLGRHQLDEALALIQRESAAQPRDAVLLDLLGEVRFRRGEVIEAAQAFQQSLTLNPCDARTHYDIGRYLNLNGLYASGQKQWDVAHKLAPEDPVIKRAWESTQQVPLTSDQLIDRLHEREQNPSITADRKAALEASIKSIQTHQKGSCELTQPVTAAKIPLYGFGDLNGRAPYGAGLDVTLNGKRRRFKLDTGASGLSLSWDAAKSLGLTPEAEVKTSGIGDNGPRDAFITHVDDLRIGPMEFHNCIVEVFESKDALHDDGLMGADVFRNFLVTLDLPGREIRLSPLPKPRDEAESATTLSTTGDDPDGSSEALTIAERKKDRYVAPEMDSWVRIFRSGHMLIFPTSIGNAPSKLFIMDTGAARTLISADAAREVTHVGSDSDLHVRGISGEVKNVYGTGNLTVTFAKVQQTQPFGLAAIDTSSFSRRSGVEISGFIGYPLLRELVIQIDYRDNLVHLTYIPHVEPGRR